MNLSMDRAGRLGDKRHRRREDGEGRLRILVARFGTRVGLQIARWSLARLYYWNVFGTFADAYVEHLDDMARRIDRVSWNDYVAWVDTRRDDAQV